MKRTKAVAMIVLGLLAAESGCGYKPARFADRPPAAWVTDDRPIAVPRRRELFEPVYYTDVYLRRELVGALDPKRRADAGDVNALDEVPGSSWYRPPANPQDPLADYRVAGPPVPPLTVLPLEPVSGIEQAVVARDARGLRYELQPDAPDRPEMRTAAQVIANRLARALGYRTPEAWIAADPSGERVAALRWPVGIDLGPTPHRLPRSDDPNDVLPHTDRRTLRTLGMVAGWLRLWRLRPHTLRDVYVGPAGHGHVQHYLVDLSGALGVEALRDAHKPDRDGDQQPPGFWLRLGTLGFAPKVPPPEPETRHLSLGWIPVQVLPRDLSPSPPFEPLDHLRPADAYWAAKRVAALPEATIDRAVAAGGLSSAAARTTLALLLKTRRLAVMRLGFEQTTPCEVVGLEPTEPGGGAVLLLEDLAVRAGLARPGRSSYRLRYLDGSGDEIAPGQTLAGSSTALAIAIPPSLWRSRDYLIAAVRSVHADREAPRELEVHLVSAGGPPRIVGIRH